MAQKNIICPVDQTMALLNKKWSVQIIRDMFFGKKHFKDFQEDKPDLSNKVLSGTLKDLEEKGLIEKKVLDTRPVTTEYNLTEYGRTLNKIIYEIAMFTLENEKQRTYNEETKNNLINLFKDTLNIDSNE